MLLRDYLGDAMRTTTTHDAYVGIPLAELSAKARGDVLEGVVRRVLEESAGEVATDPVVGVSVAGSKRPLTSAPYDFSLRGRRVEVKSAQLKYDKHRLCWFVSWQQIKSDMHDDLYLAMYTPSGVFLFKHDGTKGVTTSGKAQESGGGQVQVCGPRSEKSVERATAVVVDKMRTMLVAHLEYA